MQFLLLAIVALIVHRFILALQKLRSEGLASRINEMDCDPRIKVAVDVGRTDKIHPVSVVIAIIADDLLHKTPQPDDNYNFTQFFVWKLLDDIKAKTLRQYKDYKFLYKEERERMSVSVQKKAAVEYIHSCYGNRLPLDFPSILRTISAEYRKSQMSENIVFTVSFIASIALMVLLESAGIFDETSRIIVGIIGFAGALFVPFVITVFVSKMRNPYQQAACRREFSQPLECAMDPQLQEAEKSSEVVFLPEAVLQPCPACQHTVSSEARFCPKCGHPLNRRIAKVSHALHGAAKTISDVKRPAYEIVKTVGRFVAKLLLLCAIMLPFVFVNFIFFPHGPELKTVSDCYSFHVFAPLLIHLPLFLSVKKLFGTRSGRIVGILIVISFAFGLIGMFSVFEDLKLFGYIPQNQYLKVVLNCSMVRVVWIAIFWVLVVRCRREPSVQKTR